MKQANTATNGNTNEEGAHTWTIPFPWKDYLSDPGLGWPALRQRLARMAVQHLEVLEWEGEMSALHPDRWPHICLCFRIFSESLCGLYLSLGDPEVKGDPKAMGETLEMIAECEGSLGQLRAKARELIAKGAYQ